MNKRVRDHQTMSIIQLDINDLLIYLPFHLKYLLPSLLLLRNHPSNLDQSTQRFKHPKIQALLDEIVNDDPKRHVPPQAIHQGFCIVPPTTTSPSPKKVSMPPSTPPHPPKKMFLSSQKQMLSKPSTEVIATT